MNFYIPFLFCISKSFSFGFQQLDDKNIYVKNRFVDFERFSSRFQFLFRVSGWTRFVQGMEAKHG